MNRNWILLFSLFIFLVACSQQRDPCLLPTDVNVRLRSVHVLSDTTYTDSLLVNLRLAAIQTDSLLYLYSGSKNISYFALRLSPLADSCQYILQPDSSVASIDTITFYYGRKLQFLSNACGYTYFFVLDSTHTTKNNIDSIKIMNHDVSTDANTKPLEHVQIFF